MAINVPGCYVFTTQGSYWVDGYYREGYWVQGYY